MKFKELKAKTEAEIRQNLTDLRAKAHELSVKSRLNQLKNTHELRQVRKDIARVMTFLRQQEQKQQ